MNLRLRIVTFLYFWIETHNCLAIVIKARFTVGIVCPHLFLLLLLIRRWSKSKEFHRTGSGVDYQKREVELFPAFATDMRLQDDARALRLTSFTRLTKSTSSKYKIFAKFFSNSFVLKDKKQKRNRKKKKHIWKMA